MYIEYDTRGFSMVSKVQARSEADRKGKCTHLMQVSVDIDEIQLYRIKKIAYIILNF